MKEIALVLTPAEWAEGITTLKEKVIHQHGYDKGEVKHIEVLHKSVDARNRNIKINLKVRVFLNQKPLDEELNLLQPLFLKQVKDAPELYIIGSGPAGLFAALKAIENGFKPIVIERGKTVRDRRRDIALLNKEHIVNEHSNYCFGEGGAGTYSDGKLYTRSGKRGNINQILHTLIYYGANKEILFEAHPHIGTNKLPQIIENIRNTIIDCGGVFYFNYQLVDLKINFQKLKGITIQQVNNKSLIYFETDRVILATGHSARDIYTLLQSKNIEIEAKPFALGLRVEHPQDLIDSIQYHCPVSQVPQARRYLPAASYSAVEQVNNRGVYSFCMCPGGIIAPCATSPGEIVTNGWSPSKRNNPFANSGIVVTVDQHDFKPYQNNKALSGMYFQSAIEQKAWLYGGKTQTAPAQRLLDFVNKKVSTTLPLCSYIPGVNSCDLNEVLPDVVASRLREGFKLFEKKMHGYLSSEAIVVGVESRTSTPVRIPRDRESLQHIQVQGLFPCGEGAGYAGGIVSAAMDGVKCAAAATEQS